MKTTDSYKKILEKALSIHMQTLFGMTVSTFAAEIAFFFVLSAQGQMETTGELYALKYVLLPTGINAAITLAAWLVYRSGRAALQVKEYTLSLLSMAAAFVIAIVHAIFPSVYLLFAFMIIFTVFYGDRVLTTITFFTGLIGRCLSAVYCIDQSVSFEALQFSDLLLAVVVLCGIYILSLTIINLENQKRELVYDSVDAWKRMRETAQRDMMTGMYNLRALQNFADRIAGGEIKPKPAFFAMWDIDGFKAINDTYGHLQGDEALKFLGGCCEETTSEMLCFRYGGDEFCAFIFDGKWAGGKAKLERLQQRLCTYRSEEHGPIPLSISIGVTPYEEGLSLDQMIARADQAMYQVKQAKKGGIILQGE